MVNKLFLIFCIILWAWNLCAQEIDINKLKKDAKSGDVEAMFKLACIYHIGFYGEDVNENLAFDFAKKSADMGNVKSQCLLANMYYIKRDFNNHWIYLKKSASNGYSYAQGLLGSRLLSGCGVKMDKREGMKWLIMSAKSGNYIFQYNLSNIYYNGEDVDQDREEGAYWLNMAASQGYIPAMYTLSLYFKTGNGMSIDIQKCVYWCQKVAESKEKEFKCFDEEFLFAPSVFDKNMILESQYQLGKYYLKGVGIDKSLSKAAYWINIVKNDGYEDIDNLWCEYRLWEYLN